jgi:photosystem II stability/assembly factor-like uncharacterized protein
MTPTAGTGPGGNPDEKLPAGEWKNVTGNLAGLMSGCGDLSGLSSKPDEDMLIAGVALRGLFSSRNGGESWERLGTAESSDTITNTPALIVYDPDHTKTWWEAGIYGDLGVYRTTDNGQTLKALGDVRFTESLAIDFSDPERKVMIAGGHEAKQTVYRSNDGGKTWSNIGDKFPTSLGCPSTLVIDADTYVVGCDFGGEGILRTTDAGKSWTMVSANGGTHSPLRASDKSIYWAQPSGGMLRSTDAGESWKAIAASNSLRQVTPVELPDGRIAAVGTKSLVATSDHGASWKAISPALPFSDPSGLVYSTQQKAFFIKHAQCKDSVLPDAIMRFDFDADQ